MITITLVQSTIGIMRILDAANSIVPQQSSTIGLNHAPAKKNIISFRIHCISLTLRALHVNLYTNITAIIWIIKNANQGKGPTDEIVNNLTDWTHWKPGNRSHGHQKKYICLDAIDGWRMVWKAYWSIILKYS